MNAELTRFTPLPEFSLTDLETVWLILSGSSVIDWQRLNMRSLDEARAFIASHGFDLTRESDSERLEAIKHSAIEYLRRSFSFPIPKPVVNASVDEMLMLASGRGHRQLCACIILKAMHIIHHVEARELLFSLAMSDQDVFRLVEERVYRLVGHMLAEGLPITEFTGGRKHRDSIYTKLMSKREAHASAIYDKQRFRIVTRTREDILPVLRYLTHHLFPFNYVVPGESINTIFQLGAECKRSPHLASLRTKMQDVPEDLTLSDNLFSAASYRVIHFVVDMPIRLPDSQLESAPPDARALGPVIFGMCEFQMVDRATEEANEVGDASHARYKDRQLAAVMDRLKLGARGKKRKARGSKRGKKG